MRLLSTTAAALAVAAALGATTAHAQSCHSLWVERNSYYQRAGYCFRTPRAQPELTNVSTQFGSEILCGGGVEIVAEVVNDDHGLRCSR